MKQRGHIALLPLVLVIVVAIAGVAYLSLNNVQLPSSITQFVQKETPETAKVNLTSQYQNPFDKNAQYINPFSEYKNPFDNLQ